MGCIAPATHTRLPAGVTRRGLRLNHPQTRIHESDDLVCLWLLLVGPAGDFATICGGGGKGGPLRKLMGDCDLRNATGTFATGIEGPCGPAHLPPMRQTASPSACMKRS